MKLNPIILENGICFFHNIFDRSSSEIIELLIFEVPLLNNGRNTGILELITDNAISPKIFQRQLFNDGRHVTEHFLNNVFSYSPCLTTWE